jgi:hypothetical protein
MEDNIADNIAEENILDLLAELGNIGSLPLENKQKLEKGIRDLVYQKRELAHVDPAFKRELADRTDRLTLVEVNDMEEKVKELDKGSLVLYSKKANSYVVYDPNKVGNFIQDYSTVFKNETIFEVVMDNNPQRLVFVIKYNMTDAHINQLKTGILRYIKSNSTYNATHSDVKVFRDTEENRTKVEIIVKTVIFDSVYEKMKFVGGFKQFLASDAREEVMDALIIADKIDFYGPKAKGIEAQLYKTPSLKSQVVRVPGDDNPDKIFDLMMTPIVINNTFVVNGNIQNTVNNIAGDYIARGATVNKTTIKKQKVVIEKNKKKTIKDFYKYIYNTKPEWYVENGKVEWSTIEEAYRSYFNDQQTPRQTISQKLNGYLFTASGRSNSGMTCKRLFSYDDLKKNAGF